MELFQFEDLQIAQKHSLYVSTSKWKPVTQNIILLSIISLFEMFRPSSDTAFSFLKISKLYLNLSRPRKKKPHLHPIKETFITNI